MTSPSHHSPRPVPADAADRGNMSAAPQPLSFKGVPVPYIAAWSGEIAADADAAWSDLAIRTNLVTGGKQLRYADERPQDRDAHGVLWHRAAQDPGRGEPYFA